MKINLSVEIDLDAPTMRPYQEAIRKDLEQLIETTVNQHLTGIPDTNGWGVDVNSEIEDDA